MHLPLFTVKVSVNKKDEIVLIPDKTLEFYLREFTNLDEERFIQVLPHPKELLHKPSYKWGKRECPCGKSTLSAGERCPWCKFAYHPGGQPYSKIHAKHNIKPVKKYADYKKTTRKCLCFYDKGELITTPICPLHGVTKNHVQTK